MGKETTVLWVEPIYRALQTSAAAIGDGEIVALGGKYATAVVQITGNMGVITFKGTVDGSTWVALNCVTLTTGAAAATAAGVGIYSVSVLGLSKFKAEVTTHGGGTNRITAVANIVPIANHTVATA